MSSITLTFTGNSSQLQADYFPAIDLSDGNFECGLVDFQTFNSIPNIDETNNLFYNEHEKIVFDRNINQHSNNTESVNSVENRECDEISEDYNGANVIQALGEPSIRRRKRAIGTNPLKEKQPLSYIIIPTGSYELEHLSKLLKKNLEPKGVKIELDASKNTLQCEVLCSQPINFSKPNTIGPLLGFRKNNVLKENNLHVSPLPADILKINVIRVECNIITGSYLNSKPSHTIHEFHREFHRAIK